MLPPGQHGKAAVTHLDERVQRLSIEPLEVFSDVQHVNLCSGNHHSDEGAVVGAQALLKKIGSLYKRGWQFLRVLLPCLVGQDDK